MNNLEGNTLLSSSSGTHTLHETPLSLALLIDCENVNHKLAEDILETASILGDCKTRQIFGNFNSEGVAPWKDKAQNMNLEVIQTRSKACGKNSADITLAVAAVHLLRDGDHDIFVIVSSDSDFTGLVESLRAGNKYVLGIGDNRQNDNVHGSLQGVCNMFIGTAQIKEMNAALANSRDAMPFVKNALLELSPNGDWTILRYVKAKILNTNPGFQSSEYGSARLIDLIDKMPEFEVKEDNKKVLIRLR